MVMMESWQSCLMIMHCTLDQLVWLLCILQSSYTGCYLEVYVHLLEHFKTLFVSV